MTASKSCPPGPTGRAARSPGHGLALPPLQSSGGSLHSRGSGEGVGGACAHDLGQAVQSAAAPGRLLPNSRRARVVLATAAPRRSSSFLPRLGVVCVRVCVCVCVCARAPTRMCPPYTCMLLLTGRGGDGSPGCQGCGICRSTPRTAAPRLGDRERAERLLMDKEPGRCPASC